MQPQLVLYIASVVGAIALFLLMPKPGKDLRVLGGVLGAAALGGLWLVLVPLFLLNDDGGLDTGFSDGQTPFYYVFSAIAIAAAVRVITHTRPVYAALWFVMVVMSSAGLLLTLSAEFMAFAMLIIYGGAILVTYMFVIMLATPPRSFEEKDDGPEYERFASEPMWAAAAGFLLLAVVLSVYFQPMQANPDALAVSDAVVAETILPGRSNADENAALGTPSGNPVVLDENDQPVVQLTNVERVGLDLFQAHPLAIELAGVILLLALVGAVVIAKTQIHDEDEGEDEPQTADSSASTEVAAQS
ncbi:NADH-quinone oxidoreductase subunit J family protein [Algisphaera agarilytica]|uniref:NADH-quinone oxidoreductase subunit J n=1 Tax=Algisphaera agarilytica TaxID=1385975 RepID=A0A7X0HAR3_9BACT|nr:NADH-quinone oxidoreductase subunit J [Algisphaera agarilytica]MBB6431271.1 NADH-quinone oxidoreductase subunit J [Algisphaera agarilytica]